MFWNSVLSLRQTWCNSLLSLIGLYVDINFSFLEEPVHSGLHLTERMVDKIWRKSLQFIENRRSFRNKQSSCNTAECKSEWVTSCFFSHIICIRGYPTRTSNDWMSLISGECLWGICFFLKVALQNLSQAIKFSIVIFTEIRTSIS